MDNNYGKEKHADYHSQAKIRIVEAENERLKTCLAMQTTDGTKQYIEKINFERENFKLKAEDERLKNEKDKYYQQTLDDEIQINELLQTLQEIKEICKSSHTSASEDYYRTANKIIQKINKVEEE